MSKKQQATTAQREIIEYSDKKNLLISASAGTGKTFVMIERIAWLIENGADISEFVIVTFTNLAAAEMKARLAAKLTEKRGNPRIAEQLEKLDTASICTLHSFCSELLRHYFYVVDIDPAFTILDDITVNTLKKKVIDDIFAQYFSHNDDDFRKVYKIFATSRREENFKDAIFRLYNFSRCLENFSEWYKQKRNNFVEYSDTNPIVTTILNDIKQMVGYYKRSWEHLAERAQDEMLPFADVFSYNAELFAKIRTDTLANAFHDIVTLKIVTLPRKKRDASEFEEQIRKSYSNLKDEIKEKFVGKYEDFTHSANFKDLWSEMQASVAYTDKLVEIIEKFDKAFWEEKKARGGVDFNDLEHLTLKLLENEETLAEIRSRYKHIFVDEYQDTNPVQETIVSRIQQGDNLFIVGDVKQSIYGFRGCDPTIFAEKYKLYDQTDVGEMREINENFRSNEKILNFVNIVFNDIMTMDFGSVDYRGTAQLQGFTPPTLNNSVCINFVPSAEKKKCEIDWIYDITAEDADEDGVQQGEKIAQRIKNYVGMAYLDDKDNKHIIGYGDIVILMRAINNSKAVDIYNTLVSHNIPVSASFKVEGFANKEVRDLISLFRVIDNPYNDIYLVGACLSPFGGFTENELGNIRLDTGDYVPFYERLISYAEKGQNEDIVNKITTFLEFLRKIRFYSRSASVCEVALKVLQETNYHLYVQSLHNGGLRLGKLYAFIDSVKDATYGQSIDKFLSYVDETESARPEEGGGSGNAVRLMTMHASKGLGFPIVILAGLETQFRMDSFDVDSNSKLGLATRYYNFDTMRRASTLGKLACDIANKTKQREEMMRLLYVAMTRAKFVLDIVATVTEDQVNGLPVLPNRAMTHLDWLMIALKKYFPDWQSKDGVELDIPYLVSLTDCDTQTNSDNMDVDINVQNGCSSDDDKNAEDKYLCEQTVNVSELQRQLEQYKYEYAKETKMPSKIVSSALDKEYIANTEEPLPERVLNVNNDRNYVGTAYHKVYQYVNYKANVNEIQQTIASLVNDQKIEQRFADMLDVDLIYQTLNNPELIELLKCGKVYHEIPFMLYTPYDEVAKDKQFSDDVILQGVIDLLVICDNKATVIDFKYTQHSDRVEQNYTAQLNSYKLAVQRICGIDDVSCYVLSIADNKLIQM